VETLLDLRQAFQICHKSEIQVCLSELPRLTAIGMHVNVDGGSEDEGGAEGDNEEEDEDDA
jgi:hypothetical protein